LVVEPWIESTLDALTKLFPTNSENAQLTSETQCVGIFRPNETNLETADLATEKTVDVLTDVNKMSVASDDAVSCSSSVLETNDDVSVNSVSQQSQSANHSTGQPDMTARTDDVLLPSTSEDSALRPANCVASTDDKTVHLEALELLTKSFPPLSNETLTVPLCPPRFLKLNIVAFDTDQAQVTSMFVGQTIMLVPRRQY
jgi:hypothetical protein